MRGQKVLTRIFQDTKESEQSHRRRNYDLLARRNEAICYRYYYYIKLHRRQYVDTLSHLENEFFISKKTIISILTQNVEFLKTLQGVSIQNLRKRYPFFVWTTHAASS